MTEGIEVRFAIDEDTMLVRNFPPVVSKATWEVIKRKIDKHLLLPYLKAHIGIRNAISRDQICNILFGIVNFNIDIEEHDFRWGKAKKAMSYLRSKSNCFIISMYDEGQHKYFVAQSIDEYKAYIKKLNATQKALEMMKQRSMRAFKEKWHKEEWHIDDEQS